MPDALITSCTRVSTWQGPQALTNATGFFFSRENRLFLVTSLHVMHDQHSGHFPDHIRTVLHTNPDNIAQVVEFSIPLHDQGRPLWREYEDQGGPVDIAVIELQGNALPDRTLFRSFTPAHLPQQGEIFPAGTRLLIPGFPLGFHDTLHHTAVVRQAALASDWNFRFQGQGMFLTDARTHRGSSGAPVVMAAFDDSSVPADLPYKLLGIHSSRFDVEGRDTTVDEALGLNCAWYSDALMAMTS